MNFLLALLFVPIGMQIDPCTTAQPPFTVNSGAPFTIAWLMDAMVPASPTDPTLVPQRIDGYYLQIDSTPRVRLSGVIIGLPCVGGPNLGKIPFTYRTTSGVSRGSHLAQLLAYNYILDVNGNPTTTEQEGPAVTVPFAAVDLTHTGPPRIPANVIIRR